MSLALMLQNIAENFTFERAKPFAGNEFANYVKKDLVKEAQKTIMFWPFDLKLKASVGQGNWAAVPWLAFFDPLITETATKGFYVVYLINADTQEIFLSLNQGTTQVYHEFGEKRGRDILRRRAVDINDRIPEFASQFDQVPIDLGSPASLPAGYEAGHAFGRRYRTGQIDEDLFLSDLNKMLAAYELLVDFGGTTPIDFMMDEAGSKDIIETRKYVLSRRIERASNVRLPVLERRGARCEGCGLEPSRHYDYQGPLRNTPLDVHHKAPIFQLSEGESRRYRIPEDFYVLCPTCHRMIHKQNNSDDLNELRNSLQFKHKL